MPKEEKLKGPVDEYDRGTPKASIEGLLAAARDGDFDRAVKYLDLRRLPEGEAREQGPLLAKHPKIVLARTVLSRHGLAQ